MSQISSPLRNTGLAFWIIAAVIAVLLGCAIWYFGRRSEHPARNNPGVSTTSELILQKV